MGVPLNLTDIQSGFLSASAFNLNNTLTEEALAKALDRTDNSDNAMEVDLDMGLNNINNLQLAKLDHQAISLGQALRAISASTDQVTSTADQDTFIASASQTVFNLNNIEYIQATNSLLVFVNGVYQRAVTDYEETSTTSITFTSELQNGDIVVVLGARFNAEVFVTEASGFAGAAQTSANNAAASAADAETSATEAESSANDAALNAGYKLGINNQTGTSYTLVASDEGDLVRVTNAGDNTVTVPTNATVPFEIGTIVNIRQSGTGTTTISPASGVTINAPQDEFTTDGEEFGVAIVKVATDEWDLVKSYAGVRNDQFEANITSLEGSSGYQKLPSGLVLQWGKNIASTSGTTHSFPIAFPNEAINLTVGHTAGLGVVTGGSIISNSQFSLQRDPDTTADNVLVYWFAIGV